MTDRHLRVLSGNRHEQDKQLPDERTIVLQAQQGDIGAFGELYEHYKDRIYNLILYSVRDAALAEDILQSVFIKVFQALPLFRQDSCFLTWIFRVALNECSNRKRRRRLFLPIGESSQAWEIRSPRPAPDEEHALAQLNRMVRSAVMQLNPKLRQIIVLRYLEDFSYEEIASILGCSAGTVASRIHRGLAALEAQLGPAGRNLCAAGGR